MAQAAVRLGVSRPYVSMLFNAGKLGEVVVTECGQRLVRASAVEGLCLARTKANVDALTPREAGVECGLYRRAEWHFKNVVRVRTVRKAPARKAPKTCATRTRRS